MRDSRTCLLHPSESRTVLSVHDHLVRKHADRPSPDPAFSIESSVDDQLFTGLCVRSKRDNLVVLPFVVPVGPVDLGHSHQSMAALLRAPEAGCGCGVDPVDAELESAMDSRDRFRVLLRAQPAPPIARAPKPTRVVSRPVAPSCVVLSCVRCMASPFARSSHDHGRSRAVEAARHGACIRLRLQPTITCGRGAIDTGSGQLDYRLARVSPGTTV
jgi:hypothetical protein